MLKATQAEINHRLEVLKDKEPDKLTPLQEAPTEQAEPAQEKDDQGQDQLQGQYQDKVDGLAHFNDTESQMCFQTELQGEGSTFQAG